MQGTQKERKKGKPLEEVGSAEINLAEWICNYKVEVRGKETEFQGQRKTLPIIIRTENLSCNALLYVSSFF